MKLFLLTASKFIAFFIAWIVSTSIISSLINIENPALFMFTLELIILILVIVFTLIFTQYIDKKRINISIFNNLFKNLLIGFVIGVLWIGVTIAILLTTGTMDIVGSITVDYISIYIFASFFNVCMQELLMRGYLYQLIKKNYNILSATIITTLLFVAMHGGAFEAGMIAVLNIITMSIFVTVLMEYTGSVLAPILVHFIWNSVGGIILGVISMPYPYLLDSTFQGNSLLSGGIYKLEGSIIVLFVNTALIILFYILNKRNYSSKR